MRYAPCLGGSRAAVLTSVACGRSDDFTKRLDAVVDGTGMGEGYHIREWSRMTNGPVERTRPPLRPPSDFRLPADTSNVLAQRLRRVHERVALSTERRTPGAIAELAIHFGQSGHRDKAYQYALMAADHARLTYADADALELLQLAERNAESDGALADVRF